MTEYRVIVKTSPRDPPQAHEMHAALILANKYFFCDIDFLRAGEFHTPDLSVKGIRWEIKSPIGNGRRTIDNILHKAGKQSKNVVIDLTRLKMRQSEAMARLNHYLSYPNHGLKKVVVITKSEQVIEILT
ncbi:MAG: hypothetical protein LKI26_09015 [Bifidobacterium tibiigranuli]|jgi:hypothetical protein|uniref:CdiA C-terminal domain-containing protein n=1 Tax=Bifidobacterium tibiigranuli TaxID=2172043 RepID=UPI0026EB7A32|nr:hypothetical protein [Bifidobacterium tibiigranuli]MCI1650759.1 hypothetical protein [Bifidobacterium tibiigranuli]MCI2186706.1 hypothetical protein [Bifidobacterium tibiigranuli]